MKRLLRLLALCLGMAAAHATPIAAIPGEAAARPRVGLVLSGGGARGLAHVGVLRALQAQRIPVDVVAGTSMGAVVGGLLARGMSPDEIEAALAQVDWDHVFEQRVRRADVPPRRKEEDFEIAAGVELGIRDGQVRLPQGTISSRGLESLIRRYTLPAAAITDFDQLPIPYRAVATDMETGAQVVLAGGDLASAMRASMSVPGVFASIEVDGRVLGDGGLVNNVPIDVARKLGADVVIAVNVGTPLAGRETLSSALGLTTQMINILTEQNVQRSLATLMPSDVLITPDLGKLTSGDFAQAARFVTLGHAATEAAAPQLARLALTPAAYAQLATERRLPTATPPVLDYVAIEGTEVTNPARLLGLLRSRPGELFNPATAAADTRQLAATGDYVRTDYRLVRGPDGLGLVLDAEDKPWGPNYLRVGLDLFTDLQGNSLFNLKFSHNRHWLTPSGTEWRNFLQIGSQPTLYSELYQPLGGAAPALLPPGEAEADWFVASSMRVQREAQSLYAADGEEEVGQVRRTEGRVTLDIGRPWGAWAEMRLGVAARLAHYEPLLLSAAYTGPTDSELWREVALRARLLVDQLDYANFPQSGYRVEAEAWGGHRYGNHTGHVLRLETQATWARTWGPHTLNLHGRVQLADMPTDELIGAYSLGGFQQLSGYRPGQIAGDAVALARVAWYMRLANPPVFARALFAGASLEAGQAWRRSDQANLDLGSWRGGASLYLGADTNIGPMYLALVFAPRGDAGLMLFIGRP
ncbi:MAG: patatin-like phospholipase family protein [Proteobacteria bacterium]|nr:patatin-like phospholipase family protein [Pseudomonadota bacterium]